MKVESLRLLWHRLTHRCLHMGKPGVGELELCHSVFNWDDRHIHVRADGDDEWATIAGISHLEDLASAETAEDLRTVLKIVDAH